jgi:hypothetical protein
MSRKDYSRFHLLKQVIRVNIRKAISGCVIVWIDFTMVILDLHGGSYSLLTEGNLVTSVTASDNTGLQFELIFRDFFAQHLC